VVVELLGLVHEAAAAATSESLTRCMLFHVCCQPSGDRSLCSEAKH
jgi:hypothetical protein